MIRQIIIVGGGSAGWMAAMIMARAWAKQGVQILLLESPDIGTIGVGEGSTPALKTFFDKMEITEAEWMPECNATYKCGITFVNWSTKPGFESYYHPFPSVIDNHTLPIFMHNAQARLGGADVYAHPARFFLSARLAAQHRSPIAHHNFPFDVQYGYHFDAVLLGKFLRKKAMQLGVVYREGHVQDVLLKDNGDIEALVINSGENLAGELFVDCTGFSGVLLQKALRTPFVSYASELFNDAAVAIASPMAETIPSQTYSIALKQGWAWKIPLTNRYGNGYVYSSSFCSADEAEYELREHLGILDAEVPARHLKMTVGRVAQHWNKNCLAIGLSQGFIEPLEATALFLIQQTLAIFVDTFEQHGFNPQQQAAFNERINHQFDGTRDYIVTHYKTSSRVDSEYWRANTRDLATISDSLRDVFSCWLQAGDLAAEIRRQDIGKYYPLPSWYCILAGMGMFPDATQLRSPTPREKRYDLNQLDDFLTRCLLNYDDHRQALDALGAGK